MRARAREAQEALKSAPPKPASSASSAGVQKTTKKLGGYECLITAPQPVLSGAESADFIVVLLHHRLGNDAVFAGAMGSIAAGIPILCTPLFGAISDRVGRRPVMLAGSIAALLLGIPILALVDHAATGVVVAAVIAGGLVLAVLQGGTAVALVEQFPDSVRATGTGIAYNVTYAIAGGTQPLLALWLVDVTGSDLAPGGILVVLALLSLVGVRLCRETAFRS